MPVAPDINLTLAASPVVSVTVEGNVTVDISTLTGGGDVLGPASSTDNAIARFNGTSGKAIQNSGITIADGASGTLSGTNTGDQNLFGTVAVSGQGNVVADTTNDTLTLVAGANITITTNPSTDSITINAASSGGDVVGPASATDNALARFDSTTGKLIQNSGITVADGVSGTLSGTNTGDQNLFNTIAVSGQSNVVADSTGDTLTLVAGTNVTITTDPTTDSVTINAASSGGDVVGPASATDNAITRFDSTTGKLVQNSGITIADGATGTLSGTNTGDQNLFGTIAVSGQSNVVADSANDTLTLVAGTNVTITTDPTTDSITINSTASGTGDVVGPASATDNALVRFDGTTGKLVQNGNVTETDDGDLASVNSITMDTTPTGSIATQGQMMWNTGEETLDIQLNGFAMHTGQHVLYHVKNSTGSTIAKGVPVMFAGTTGNSGKLLIQPWNGTGPSTYFMGLTAEELLTGDEGFVIAFGKLNGIQTNGGNYGETWADGEIIYAGTTTGSLTKTQPAAPNPHVQVLAVVHAHASNGTVFINRTLGSNIKDDEGVTITSLSTGQILVANNAGTVFENKSMSGDATLANTGALTLATVNSNTGSFGSATTVPVITVNAKGLTTAVSTSTITPAIGSITGLGTGVATALAVNVGTAGAVVVNGGALGTPSSGTLTSCTGLPISTGVSGLGFNVAASLANPLVTSGTLVVTGGALGTPSSGTLTSCTGLPISTGVTGLGINVAASLANPLATSGTLLISGGALGTPSSGTLTSCTGLPISTGVSGLGTNVAASLANAMSASGTLAILGANTFTGAQTVNVGTLATASVSVSQTWNSGATVCRGVEVAVTNTNSATASTLLRLLTGASASTVAFSVNAATGSVTAGASSNSATITLQGSDRSAVLNLGAFGNEFRVGNFQLGSTNVSLRFTDTNAVTRYGTIYGQDTDVLALRNGSGGTTGAAWEMLEMTAPGTPAADRLRLYAEDNGSGKTRLVIKWSDGSTTTIATQP